MPQPFNSRQNEFRVWSTYWYLLLSYITDFCYWSEGAKHSTQKRSLLMCRTRNKIEFTNSTIRSDIVPSTTYLCHNVSLPICIATRGRESSQHFPGYYNKNSHFFLNCHPNVVQGGLINKGTTCCKGRLTPKISHEMGNIEDYNIFI